jgi:hypothetical protein
LPNSIVVMLIAAALRSGGGVGDIAVIIVCASITETTVTFSSAVDRFRRSGRRPRIVAHSAGAARDRVTIASPARHRERAPL